MIEVAAASLDEVRAIGRRRNVDDLTLRLSLQSAERGTAWTARDGGEAIGIAIAHDSDEERYVGDLFVEPSYREHGVAGELLSTAFESREDRSRTMIFDPSDRAGMTVALRCNMAARETLLRFAGAIPREEALVKMAAGEYRFQVETIDAVAHSPWLNELDHRTRGTVRPKDHAMFARAAFGNAFVLNGEFVGYAYVSPDGRIGPVACASEAYLVQMFAYALVTLQRMYAASWCTLLVPGLNRRVARVALRAGLRIEETFLFASDAFIGDLSAYVGYHRLLL